MDASADHLTHLEMFHVEQMALQFGQTGAGSTVAVRCSTWNNGRDVGGGP